MLETICHEHFHFVYTVCLCAHLCWISHSIHLILVICFPRCTCCVKASSHLQALISFNHHTTPSLPNVWVFISSKEIRTKPTQVILGRHLEEPQSIEGNGPISSLLLILCESYFLILNSRVLNVTLHFVWL